MRWRSHLGVCGLVAAAVALALVADWWLASNRTPPPADPPTDLVVPARAVQATLVGFQHDGPPQWPRGNCFAVSPGLSVANMHLENFARAVRDLGLETVAVRRVGDGRCLVTDPRIPRDWLLAEPCPTCTPPEVRRELTEAYPQWFRPKQTAAAPGDVPDRGGLK
jgi:hypothetical protein